MTSLGLASQIGRMLRDHVSAPFVSAAPRAKLQGPQDGTTSASVPPRDHGTA